MTALPATLALCPEMLELGVSVASVALADGPEERYQALSNLWHAIGETSACFEALRAGCKRRGDEILTASGEELRAFLERAGTAERSSVALHGRFCRLLASEGFQSVLKQTSTEFNGGELRKFLDQWMTVYIPSIRRLRLAAITTIFRRLEEQGISDARLGHSFSDEFLRASLDEADSWQETAHLLASPQNASRLLDSIHMGSEDRTGDLNPLSKPPVDR